MNKDEVVRLSKLARIDISDTEAESLSKEFDSILNYVGEVKAVATNNQQPTTNNYGVKNVMREDENPHEGGLYTDKVLKQAPHTKGKHIVVKKIL